MDSLLSQIGEWICKATRVVKSEIKDDVMTWADSCRSISESQHRSSLFLQARTGAKGSEKQSR